MSPVAPIPQAALVGANGLNASVIEVSGELSITRVLPVLGVLVVLPEDCVDPGAAELELGLEEHAAMPAASRPAAAAAMNRRFAFTLYSSRVLWLGVHELVPAVGAPEHRRKLLQTFPERFRK
jgi:hypothetical protein